MIVLSIAAGLLSIPVAILLVEVLGALKPSKMSAFERENFAVPARVAVLVPAHNESAGLIPTLEDIKPQLNAADRLIVIADNCTDDTAAVARSAGATVIERNDRQKIGKGYAMAYGIAHLDAAPPDLVLFVDADCRLQTDLIEKLKPVCLQVKRPVQALFLMLSGAGSPINHSFAEFAWILKNWVRPLGMRNLGGPVQLMGTGMMFPWQVIRMAPLASGNIVEDLKLGLDLAAIGKAPYFFPFAKVLSEFPATAKGTDGQRQRWVSGHLVTILNTVPRLFAESLFRRDKNLLAMTLDVLVPPISLLALVLAGMFLLTTCGALISSHWAAMLIASANLVAFIVAVSLAWFRFGRNALSPRQVLSIPAFLFGKLGFYTRLALGRASSHWVRADRTKSD